MTILNEIIQILTGGLVTFGQGIGNGIQAMVKALFIETVEGVDGLSVFGQVIAIFAAVALAVGITRRLFTMVATMGGRK